MNTIETLEAIRRCNQNCSDYRIAKLMNIRGGYMSLLLSGDKKMTESHRVQAAKLLNQDPELHLIYRSIECAKCTDIKHLWKDALKRITTTAAALVLTFSATLTPQEAHANHGHNTEQSIHYAQYSIAHY